MPRLAAELTEPTLEGPNVAPIDVCRVTLVCWFGSGRERGLLGREHVVQLSISRPGRPLAEPIISLYIVLDLLGLGRDSLLWRHTSAIHPTNRFRARDGWASSW